MTMKASNDIRREFIEFFRQRGHMFVPSSPLLPADDPTLLFANAGMNQFKDVFLGTGRRDYTRAVNSQKCIRAGGKHNDLEDVGHDTYHQTFFEMLGNWSFGDYFKAEAIQWAWELLTKVWGLPPQRLHATVFGGDVAENLEGDEEARRLWLERTSIDPSHLHDGSTKDNFWAPGDTGPCGPCSEIHVDLTEDLSGGKLVNAGDPRVIELWNLVFMQFSRGSDGRLAPLPAKHVDTGMGFERLCALMQGKRSSYATDVFVPIIQHVERLSGYRYGDQVAKKQAVADRFDITGQDDIRDVACRVIADHARALTFAIADGVIPSNEGRGYVLRRILRRAARYGRQYLKLEGSFLSKLVPTIVEQMGQAFGEIRQRRDHVGQTIQEEEESFGRTLDRGIELFTRQAKRLKKAGQSVLPGEVMFELYATYGFPADLTQIMAGEVGLGVDIDGYETQMARHRQISGAGEAFKVTAVANLPATDDSAKCAPDPLAARVLGWVADGEFRTTGKLRPQDQAAVVLDRTNFYGEAGGQVGDAGRLSWDGGRFAVRDTQLAGQCVLHIGVVEQGELAAGWAVAAHVDPARLDTMRNHTATHLLNWALREVLGGHITQSGSVVAPDRLRFDFTHGQALDEEQLRLVERKVNQRVMADETVHTMLMPLAQARQIPGVRAAFGERYPDPVRVVSVGSGRPALQADSSTAVEFCGGTHLERTGQIGLFKILSEESVAKGMRRITAVTGQVAVEHVQQMEAALRSASQALRASPGELAERIASLQQEVKQLRKRPSGAEGGGTELRLRQEVKTPHGLVLIAQDTQAQPDAMRSLCDQLRQKGAVAVMLGAAKGQKVTLVAMVDQALVEAGKLRADDWIRKVAPVVGGGGGGKGTLAQAGGKDPSRLAEALEAAGRYASTQLA
jgi:alanyl-tRNA synthetase